MTELTKDNYDNLDDDIDFIIHTVMALPEYTHYDFIKGRLMRAYNQGRWDVYVEESNKNTDELHQQLEHITGMKYTSVVR